MKDRLQRLTTALYAIEVALSATQDGYEELPHVPPRIERSVTVITETLVDLLDWTRGEMTVTSVDKASLVPELDLPTTVNRKGSEN
jgi:hypothetical protein